MIRTEDSRLLLRPRAQCCCCCRQPVLLLSAAARSRSAAVPVRLAPGPAAPASHDDRSGREAECPDRIRGTLSL
eukprot:483225-Hanusia_phi.AAC.1